jgi:hypothetical protein
MGQPLSQPVFIYRIICIPTGKCYIGMTQTTIRRRWHLRQLQNTLPSEKVIAS